MRLRSLTTEYQAVVESTQKVLKIDAVAGSSKATTLLAYAVRSMPEAHPAASHADRGMPCVASKQDGPQLVGTGCTKCGPAGSAPPCHLC